MMKRALFASSDPGGSAALGALASLLEKTFAENQVEFVHFVEAGAPGILPSGSIALKTMEIPGAIRRLSPDAVIIGTSTQSTFGLEFIRLAQEAGIPDTACVFDHWTDFENRLHLKGERLKPKVIFVVNEEAQMLAHKTTLSEARIIGHPAIQLLAESGHEPARSREEILATLSLPKDKPLLVHISDALSEECGGEPAARARFGYSEMDSLALVMKEAASVGVSVAVKLHPKEDPGKFKGSAAHFTRDIPLLDLLCIADYCTGMFSTGLLQAVALGHHPLRIEPEAKDDWLRIGPSFFSGRVLRPEDSSAAFTALIRSAKGERRNPFAADAREAIKEFLRIK